MPYAPQPACKIRTCPNRAEKWGYCKDHYKEIEEHRLTAAERGYDNRWNKARKLFLNEHPICVMCEKEGRPSPATIVDHIQPHKGNYELFWDQTNWQSLCDYHHRAKTMKESFGKNNER